MSEDRSMPVTSSHHLIVERMEALGRLELVRYYLKDIVEHTERIKWWPFDPKAILIVSGEVVGCLDLSRIDSADIQVFDDRIEVLLPEPEICYTKVDHQQSRVYDISNLSNKQDAALIDEAYKVAERKIEEGALEARLLEQTKMNARGILGPILETLTSKRVVLRFKD